MHLHAAALVKHISLTIKQTPLELTPLCVVFHSGRARACQDWKGRSNKPQRQSRTAQSLQGRGLHGLRALQLPEEGRAFSGIPGDCSIVSYPEFAVCKSCFSYAFMYISCSGWTEKVSLSYKRFCVTATSFYPQLVILVIYVIGFLELSCCFIIYDSTVA